MKKVNRIILWLAILLLLVILPACGSSAEQIVILPTITRNMLPTWTPLASKTATLPAPDTATPAPSRTPTATALASPAVSSSTPVTATPTRDEYFQLAFDRPFENSGLSFIGGSASANNISFGQSENGYAFKIIPADRDLLIGYDTPLQNADVLVDTVANKLSGPNSNEIGVFCRLTEAGGYFFTYSSTGNWRIYQYTPTGITDLASGSSRAIKLAERANHLLASCKGDQLSLTVNDQVIGSASDSAFSEGGKVGFSLWGKFPELEVEFQYLKTSAP